jgi:ABC-type Fe3+ transport system permease subunit
MFFVLQPQQTAMSSAVQTTGLSLDVPIASPEREVNNNSDQQKATQRRRQQQEQPKRRRTRYSCKAIASLICALASVPLYFFWYPSGWLVGSIAVCLAVAALYEIKESPDQEVIMGGRCMATTGLIIGIIEFILSIIVIITMIILSSKNASSPASTTYTYHD